MLNKKPLRVEYRFVDHEQLDRQKRLDDAFDVIFDEIVAEYLERINNKNKYDHPNTINR